MLKAEDICFSYRPENEAAREVLRGVSLQLLPGEWLALLGPNGSGKSTLARQLNGLLLPDSGRVCVDGLYTDDAKDLWRLRAQVGFVFQDPDRQIVGVTVADDIAFGPENLGLPREEIAERVEEAAAATGISELLSRSPHQLSGGQKQRLAIAGALAMRPSYLVLDEPASMLNPSGRRELLALLEKLRRERGLGIVYITHFLEEMMAADRVLLLDAGSAVWEGEPVALLAEQALLERLGMQLPAVSRLAASLSAGGLPGLAGVWRHEDLVEALCRSK